MFRFYLPENNPSDLTGVVGGDISPITYTGYVGELLVDIPSAPSGNLTGEYQYRKLFVKNEYSTSSTNTRLWLDSVEHSGQISVSVAINNDSILNSRTEPSSVTWSSPYNWVEGINLGTLASNSYTGIWIRQYLSGITESDPYATFRLGVGGLIV